MWRDASAIAHARGDGSLAQRARRLAPKRPPSAAQASSPSRTASSLSLRVLVRFRPIFRRLCIVSYLEYTSRVSVLTWAVAAESTGRERGQWGPPWTAKLEGTRRRRGVATRPSRLSLRRHRISTRVMRSAHLVRAPKSTPPPRLEVSSLSRTARSGS